MNIRNNANNVIMMKIMYRSHWKHIMRVALGHTTGVQENSKKCNRENDYIKGAAKA